MSMYAQCSEQYWKERRKDHSKIKFQTLITILSVILSFLGVVGIRWRHQRRIQLREEKAEQRKRRLESLVRPNPTEDHYKRCEVEISTSLQLECNDICNHERKSIPRPLMHEACIHGCASSISASALSGCRQASEDDVFRKYGNQAYTQCSRFQNTDPRPDVYSTCRKYHREGARKGRLIGFLKMDEILNGEFVDLRRKYEMEDI